MDFVPEVSAIKTEGIEVDKETIEMLAALGMADLPGVVKQSESSVAAAGAVGFGGRGGFSGRNRY